MFNLKKSKLLYLLFVLALLFQGFVTLAQSESDSGSVTIPEAPNPHKFFNDYLGVVSASEASDLEAQMVRMNDSTTVQIAVVVVPTVGQYDIADYAQQLATKWGIGQKDKNNGVLLDLAMNDRKSRIQVGYGLEGVLTDILTSHIQDKVLKPLMRQEQNAKAISETVNAIYQAAKGEYKAEVPSRLDSIIGNFPKEILWTFLIIFVFIGYASVYSFLAQKYPNSWLFRNSGEGSGGGSSSSGSWGSSSSSSGSSSSSSFGGGSFGGGGSSGSW